MKPPEPTTGEGSCRIAEWQCKASAAITVLQRKARNLLSQCWQPSACVSAHARVSVRVCVHHVCMCVCVYREDSIHREGQDQTEFETFLLPQCRVRGDREVGGGAVGGWRWRRDPGSRSGGTERFRAWSLSTPAPCMGPVIPTAIH